VAQPVVAVDEVAQRLLVLEQLPEHLAERGDQARCPGTDQRARARVRKSTRSPSACRSAW